MNKTESLTDRPLQVDELSKYFLSEKSLITRWLVGTQWIKAVEGVSLSVQDQEVLALVGESGCGKTTLARLILGLIEPTEGEIFIQGKTYQQFGKELATTLQAVFQEGLASLNPRKKVGEVLREPMEVHGIASGGSVQDKVNRTLGMVGLSESFATRYPHELSGGQAQRVVIARALSVDPSILIADEPTSALDVSIQAKILDLLMDLKDRLGLTMLHITHDLGTVRQVSDRVAIMYLGEIVETGFTTEVFSQPFHPYTKALLSATPIPDPTVERDRLILQGEVPSPVNKPSGCPLHPRCPYSQEKCTSEKPQLSDALASRPVSCHFPLLED